MIIPLNFEEVFTVWCFARAPKYHNNAFGKIKFIVDTGSSGSFIGEEDAKRIRIPTEKLELDKDKIGRGLAGGAINLYKISDITFSFLDAKTEQIQRIQCKNFHVAKCASRKPEMKIKDNILGNDFLINHKLKLIANPHSESYLESV